MTTGTGMSSDFMGPSSATDHGQWKEKKTLSKTYTLISWEKRGMEEKAQASYGSNEA